MLKNLIPRAVIKNPSKNILPAPHKKQSVDTNDTESLINVNLISTSDSPLIHLPSDGLLLRLGSGAPTLPYASVRIAKRAGDGKRNNQTPLPSFLNGSMDGLLLTTQQSTRDRN